MIIRVMKSFCGNINDPLKHVSKVLLLVATFWLMAQWFGSFLSWPYMLVFVFDFLAFLGFLWVIVVLLLRRKLAKHNGEN